MNLRYEAVRHDAVLQPERIAQRDDRRTLLERIGIAERERGKAGGIDADDGEIELAIPRVNFR